MPRKKDFFKKAQVPAEFDSDPESEPDFLGFERDFHGFEPESQVDGQEQRRLKDELINAIQNVTETITKKQNNIEADQQVNSKGHDIEVAMKQCMQEQVDRVDIGQIVHNPGIQVESIEIQRELSNAHKVCEGLIDVAEIRQILHDLVNKVDQMSKIVNSTLEIESISDHSNSSENQISQIIRELVNTVSQLAPKISSLPRKDNLRGIENKNDLTTMGDYSVREIKTKDLFHHSEPVQLFKADDNLAHEEQDYVDACNDQIADKKVDTLEEDIVTDDKNMPNIFTQTNESTNIDRQIPDEEEEEECYYVLVDEDSATVPPTGEKDKTSRSQSPPWKDVVEEPIMKPQFVEEMFYKDFIDDSNVQVYLPDLNENEKITVILEMDDDSLHNQNEIDESQLPLQIVDEDQDSQTHSEGNLFRPHKMANEVLYNMQNYPKSGNNDQLHLSNADKDADNGMQLPPTTINVDNQTNMNDADYSKYSVAKEDHNVKQIESQDITVELLIKENISSVENSNEIDLDKSQYSITEEPVNQKQKISGENLRSEDNISEINDTDTSEYSNAEKIDKGTPHNSNEDEKVDREHGIQFEPVVKNEIELQMREIIHENFEEWLPGVQTESINMDAIEFELEDLMNEHLHNQVPGVETESIKMGAIEFDLQNILRSTDIVCDTGQPQLSNEYEDEYDDNDNSQYLIAEEEMNQDFRILKESTGENQDNRILIERQMLEIMGEHLEECVNYVHGVETAIVPTDAIEFELQKLMNERLDILQNPNVIMTDSGELVRKPQPKPKPMEEQLLPDIDKSARGPSPNYYEIFYVNSKSNIVLKVDEQDIIDDNKIDLELTNLDEGEEILISIEESTTHTTQNQADDVDDLLLSNTEDYQIVNSEDKIQETKAYDYDQQNFADKNETDYEQVIQADKIEQQLQKIVGEISQDQPHKNLPENAEFDLLQCLQDDKVDKIENDSSSPDYPSDPDDPDDPDYVPTNEEETEERSPTSTFAEICEALNLGHPEPETPKFASQQADLISHLRGNLPTSKFVRRVRNVTTRYRGRPQGTTGIPWGPRKRCTGHRIVLTKLEEMKKKVNRLKRPFYIKVPPEILISTNLPTDHNASLKSPEKLDLPTENLVPQQSLPLAQLSVNQIIDKARKFAKQIGIDDITSYPINSPEQRGGKDEKNDQSLNSDFNNDGVIIGASKHCEPIKTRPTIKIISQEIIRPAINIIQHEILKTPTVPVLKGAVHVHQIQSPIPLKLNVPISNDIASTDFKDLDAPQDPVCQNLIQDLTNQTNLKSASISKISKKTDESMSSFKSSEPPISSLKSTDQSISHSKYQTSAKKFNHPTECMSQTKSYKTSENSHTFRKLLSPSQFHINIKDIDKPLRTGYTDQQLLDPQIASSSSAQSSLIENAKIFNPKFRFIMPNTSDPNYNYMVALAEQQKIIRTLRTYNRQLLKNPSQPKIKIPSPSSSPPKRAKRRNYAQCIKNLKNLSSSSSPPSSPPKTTKRRNYAQCIKNLKNLSSSSPINLTNILTGPDPNLVQYRVTSDVTEPNKINVSVLFDRTPKFKICANTAKKIKHHYKILHAGPGIGNRKKVSDDIEENCDDLKNDIEENCDDLKNDGAENSAESISQQSGLPELPENISKLQALPNLPEKSRLPLRTVPDEQNKTTEPKLVASSKKKTGRKTKIKIIKKRVMIKKKRDVSKRIGRPTFINLCKRRERRKHPPNVVPPLTKLCYREKQFLKNETTNVNTEPEQKTSDVSKIMTKFSETGKSAKRIASASEVKVPLRATGFTKVVCAGRKIKEKLESDKSNQNYKDDKNSDFVDDDLNMMDQVLGEDLNLSRNSKNSSSEVNKEHSDLEDMGDLLCRNLLYLSEDDSSISKDTNTHINTEPKVTKDHGLYSKMHISSDEISDESRHKFGDQTPEKLSIPRRSAIPKKLLIEKKSPVLQTKTLSSNKKSSVLKHSSSSCSSGLSFSSTKQSQILMESASSENTAATKKSSTSKDLSNSKKSPRANTWTAKKSQIDKNLSTAKNSSVDKKSSSATNYPVHKRLSSFKKSPSKQILSKFQKQPISEQLPSSKESSIRKKMSSIEKSVIPKKTSPNSSRDSSQNSRNSSRSPLKSRISSSSSKSSKNSLRSSSSSRKLTDSSASGRKSHSSEKFSRSSSSSRKSSKSYSSSRKSRISSESYSSSKTSSRTYSNSRKSSKSSSRLSFIWTQLSNSSESSRMSYLSSKKSHKNSPNFKKSQSPKTSLETTMENNIKDKSLKTYPSLKLSSSDSSPEMPPVIEVKIPKDKNLETYPSLKLFSSDSSPEIPVIEVKIPKDKNLETYPSLKLSSSDSSPEMPPVIEVKIPKDKNLETYPSLKLFSSDSSPEIPVIEVKIPKDKNLETYPSLKLSSSHSSPEIPVIEVKIPKDKNLETYPSLKLSSSHSSPEIPVIEVKTPKDKNLETYPSLKLSSSDSSPEIPVIEVNIPKDKNLETYPSLKLSSSDSSPEIPVIEVKIPKDKNLETYPSLKLSSSDSSPEIPIIEVKIPMDKNLETYPSLKLSSSDSSPEKSVIEVKIPVPSEIENPELAFHNLTDCNRSKETISAESLQKIFQIHKCPALLSCLPPTPPSEIIESPEHVEIIREQTRDIKEHASDKFTNIDPQISMVMDKREVIISEKKKQDENEIINSEILSEVPAINPEETEDSTTHVSPNPTETPTHHLLTLSDVTADELQYLNSVIMTAMPNIQESELNNLPEVTEELPYQSVTTDVLECIPDITDDLPVVSNEILANLSDNSDESNWHSSFPDTLPIVIEEMLDNLTGVSEEIVHNNPLTSEEAIGEVQITHDTKEVSFLHLSNICDKDCDNLIQLTKEISEEIISDSINIPCSESMLSLPEEFKVSSMLSPEFNISQLDKMVHGSDSPKPNQQEQIVQESLFISSSGSSIIQRTTRRSRRLSSSNSSSESTKSDNSNSPEDECTTRRVTGSRSSFSSSQVKYTNIRSNICSARSKRKQKNSSSTSCRSNSPITKQRSANDKCSSIKSASTRDKKIKFLTDEKKGLVQLGSTPNEKFKSPSDKKLNSPSDKKSVSPSKEKFYYPSDMKSKRFYSESDKKPETPSAKKPSSPSHEKSDSPSDDKSNPPLEDMSNCSSEEKSNTPSDKKSNSTSNERSNSSSNSPSDETSNSLTDEKSNSTPDERFNSPPDEMFNSPSDEKFNDPSPEKENPSSEENSNSPCKKEVQITTVSTGKIHAKQKDLHAALYNLIDSYKTESTLEAKSEKLSRNIDRKEKKIVFKENLLISKEQELKILMNKELNLLKSRCVLVNDEKIRLKAIKITKLRNEDGNQEEEAKKFKKLEMIYLKQYATLNTKKESIRSDIKRIRKSLKKMKSKLNSVKEKAHIINIDVEYFHEVEGSDYFLDSEAESSSSSQGSSRDSKPGSRSGKGSKHIAMNEKSAGSTNSSEGPQSSERIKLKPKKVRIGPVSKVLLSAIPPPKSSSTTFKGKPEQAYSSMASKESLQYSKPCPSSGKGSKDLRRNEKFADSSESSGKGPPSSEDETVSNIGKPQMETYFSKTNPTNPKPGPSSITGSMGLRDSDKAPDRTDSNGKRSQSSERLETPRIDIPPMGKPEKRRIAPFMIRPAFPPILPIARPQSSDGEDSASNIGKPQMEAYLSMMKGTSHPKSYPSNRKDSKNLRGSNKASDRTDSSGERSQSSEKEITSNIRKPQMKMDWSSSSQESSRQPQPGPSSRNVLESFSNKVKRTYISNLSSDSSSDSSSKREARTSSKSFEQALNFETRPITKPGKVKKTPKAPRPEKSSFKAPETNFEDMPAPKGFKKPIPYVKPLNSVASENLSSSSLPVATKHTIKEKRTYEDVFTFEDILHPETNLKKQKVGDSMTSIQSKLPGKTEPIEEKKSRSEDCSSMKGTEPRYKAKTTDEKKKETEKTTSQTSSQTKEKKNITKTKEKKTQVEDRSSSKIPVIKQQDKPIMVEELGKDRSTEKGSKLKKHKVCTNLKKVDTNSYVSKTPITETESKKERIIVKELPSSASVKNPEKQGICRSDAQSENKKPDTSLKEKRLKKLSSIQSSDCRDQQTLENVSTTIPTPITVQQSSEVSKSETKVSSSPKKPTKCVSTKSDEGNEMMYLSSLSSTTSVKVKTPDKIETNIDKDSFDWVSDNDGEKSNLSFNRALSLSLSSPIWSSSSSIKIVKTPDILNENERKERKMKAQKDASTSTDSTSDDGKNVLWVSETDFSSPNIVKTPKKIESLSKIPPAGEHRKDVNFDTSSINSAISLFESVKSSPVKIENVPKSQEQVTEIEETPRSRRMVPVPRKITDEIQCAKISDKCKKEDTKSSSSENESTTSSSRNSTKSRTSSKSRGMAFNNSSSTSQSSSKLRSMTPTGSGSSKSASREMRSKSILSSASGNTRLQHSSRSSGSVCSNVFNSTRRGNSSGSNSPTEKRLEEEAASEIEMSEDISTQTKQSVVPKPIEDSEKEIIFEDIISLGSATSHNFQDEITRNKSIRIEEPNITKPKKRTFVKSNNNQVLLIKRQIKEIQAEEAENEQKIADLEQKIAALKEWKIEHERTKSLSRREAESYQDERSRYETNKPRFGADNRTDDKDTSYRTYNWNERARNVPSTSYDEDLNRKRRHCESLRHGNRRELDSSYLGSRTNSPREASQRSYEREPESPYQLLYSNSSRESSRQGDSRETRYSHQRRIVGALREDITRRQVYSHRVMDEESRADHPNEDQSDGEHSATSSVAYCPSVKSRIVDPHQKSAPASDFSTGVVEIRKSRSKKHRKSRSKRHRKSGVVGTRKSRSKKHRKSGVVDTRKTRSKKHRKSKSKSKKHRKSTSSVSDSPTRTTTDSTSIAILSTTTSTSSASTFRSPKFTTSTSSTPNEHEETSGKKKDKSGPNKDDPGANNSQPDKSTDEPSKSNDLPGEANYQPREIQDKSGKRNKKQCEKAETSHTIKKKVNKNEGKPGEKPKVNAGEENKAKSKSQSVTLLPKIPKISGKENSRKFFERATATSSVLTQSQDDKYYTINLSNTRSNKCLSNKLDQSDTARKHSMEHNTAQSVLALSQDDADYQVDRYAQRKRLIDKKRREDTIRRHISWERAYIEARRMRTPHNSRYQAQPSYIGYPSSSRHPRMRYHHPPRYHHTVESQTPDNIPQRHTQYHRRFNVPARSYGSRSSTIPNPRPFYTSRPTNPNPVRTYATPLTNPNQSNVCPMVEMQSYEPMVSQPPVPPPVIHQRPPRAPLETQSLLPNYERGYTSK